MVPSIAIPQKYLIIFQKQLANLQFQQVIPSILNVRMEIITYLRCKRIKHTPYPPEFGPYANINSVDDILKTMTPLHKTGDTICKQ